MCLKLIPTEFGAGINATDNTQDMLKTPGVKKIVEMVGLDINKVEVKKELEAILNKLIIATPDNLAIIFSSLIHELALKKSKLSLNDFQNKNELNEVHESLRALKLQLAPGKYNEIVTALNTSDSLERKQALMPLQEELGEDLINTIEKFRTKITELTPAIPANYDTLVKEHDKFKQQLEMNFMAAGGENSLLRSWEYSLAAYGHSDDEKMMANFQAILSQAPKTSFARLWEQFLAMLCNLIGLEVEIQDPDAAQRMGILGILDNVLDEAGADYSPFMNFDRSEFKKAFAENFEKRLSERLITKFEEGVFKLYDKTRATNEALEKLLNNKKEIQEAIGSIAYHAAGDCVVIDENAPKKQKGQQRQARTDNDIGKKLDQAIKRDDFLQDLVTIYASATGQKEQTQFSSTVAGGYQESVFAAYIGKPFKEVPFSRDPRNFIKEMVSNLRPMIENESLNIDGKTEIMFLMRDSGHGFLMRPDLEMLKQVIDSNDVDAWIEQNLIQQGKMFIVADLIWVNYGQHTSLAIKSENGQLKFVKVDEDKGVIPEPKYDANHKFGDSEFTVMFEV